MRGGVISNRNVCDIEGDWHLVKRNGKLEMWHNRNTDKWGVYLYEHEQQDEYWLLYGIRDSEEDALEKFDLIVSLLR